MSLMALVKVERGVGDSPHAGPRITTDAPDVMSHYPSIGGRPSRTSHIVGVSDVNYISIVANGFLIFRYLVSSI